MKRSRYLSHVSSALVAASLAYGVYPSSAAAEASDAALQSSARGDEAQPSTASEDTGLQEIVVTAQKRSQSLQDIPVAVSAMGGDALAAANITNAIDLGRLVPSLGLYTSGAVVQPFLRGIGTPGSILGNENSVATYLDDVYIARVPPALLQLNNIERVEVLKGPQGTLFGRNASGGLIHIVTNEPSESPALSGSIGYGNYGTFRGDLYATAGLAPGLAFNVSGLISDQDNGWGRNRALGSDWGKDSSKAIRGKLWWEAGPSTTISVTGDYSKSENDLLPHSEYRFSGPRRGFTLPPYGLQPVGGFYDIDQNAQPDVKSTAWGVSGKIEQDLKFATLASITAYRENKEFNVFDSDYTNQNAFLFRLYGTQKQFSQEFQLSSRGNQAFEWIAGLYYFNAEGGYSNEELTGDVISSIAPLIGFPAGTRLEQSSFGFSKNKSYAGYGQATWHISENTGITVGGRYTKDKLSGFGGSAIFIEDDTRPDSPITRSRTQFNKFTYKIAIDQRVAEHVLLYASQSRGYKSGIYNVFPFTPNAAEPEILDASEVGIKSELFDRRLRINGSAFYYSFKDAQFVLYDGPRVNAINADSARIFGTEIEGEASISRGFNVRFGVSYVDGKYTKFTNSQSIDINTNTNPALGYIGGYAPTPNLFDASGNDMIRVPKWTANIGANYTFDTMAGIFDLSANYSYQAPFSWDTTNHIKEPSRNLLDAQIKYTFPNQERFALRLWAKNITDEHYYISQTASTGAVGNAALPGAPRTYGFDWIFKL